LEAVAPNLNVSSKTTMNIYNMHRIRRTGPSYGSIRLKLDNGERYNVLTFFTGFSGSTSPDGFTGDYGSEFGIAERVIALFLPMDVKTQEYEEILAKLSSRIVINSEKIEENIDIAGNLVKKSGLIPKPDELYDFLESHLDRKLSLSETEIKDAKHYEVKALHYLLEEKKDIIQDLRINPAKSALKIDQQKLDSAEKKEKKIKDLINKMQAINTEKQMTEALSSQQQETIDQLKEDYKVIFGTLTEQIMMLENELGAIKESTQGLVTDLNNALAEKIQKIDDLKAEVKKLKAEQKQD